MKIVILSRKPSLYSTRRLREAGEQRGHDVQVIDYLRCYMNITAHNPQVIFRGQPIQGVDAIIPRIGASQTFYGTAVVRQFEMMGVASANSSIAISRSRDKLRCLQLLSRRGIGLPVTGFAHATKDVTARKYTGKEFPWRNPGSVTLVIEVDRAKFARIPFTHAPAGAPRQ